MWSDPSHDPTVKRVVKKMRKRGGGPVKQRESFVPTSSFFRIFTVMDEEDAGADDMLPVHELQVRMRGHVAEHAAGLVVSCLGACKCRKMPRNPS